MAALERERLRRVQAQIDLLLYSLRSRYGEDLSPSLIARVEKCMHTCDQIGQQYAKDCAVHAQEGEVTARHTLPGFRRMSEEE